MTFVDFSKMFLSVMDEYFKLLFSFSDKISRKKIAENNQEKLQKQEPDFIKD